MAVGAASWSFTEDDFGAITTSLQKFLFESYARCALRVDRSGQLVATNPMLEGEATALYVQEQLSPHDVLVSRIALGMPVGGDLEYADGVTIAQAIASRRLMR